MSRYKNNTDFTFRIEYLTGLKVEKTSTKMENVNYFEGRTFFIEIHQSPKKHQIRSVSSVVDLQNHLQLRQVTTRQEFLYGYLKLPRNSTVFALLSTGARFLFSAS